MTTQFTIQQANTSKKLSNASSDLCRWIKACATATALWPFVALHQWFVTSWTGEAQAEISVQVFKHGWNAPQPSDHFHHGNPMKTLPSHWWAQSYWPSLKCQLSTSIMLDGAFTAFVETWIQGFVWGSAWSGKYWCRNVHLKVWSDSLQVAWHVGSTVVCLPSAQPGNILHCVKTSFNTVKIVWASVSGKTKRTTRSWQTANVSSTLCSTVTNCSLFELCLVSSLSTA